MIHAVQYEIYLTKQLDYFNDILPICIEIRRMLKYSEVIVDLHESKYKIVVFGHEKFINRFNLCSPHSIKYQSALNKFGKANSNEEILYSNIKLYKNKIKHCPKNQIPIDKDKYNELESMYFELDSALNAYTKYNNYTQSEIQKLEYDKIKLFDVLEIQRFVQNTKYFDKLVEIEKELTNIELSKDENQILQKILNHPTINGYVDFHGFNLVEVKN